MTFDFREPFPIKTSNEAPSGSSVPTKNVVVAGSDGNFTRTLNVDENGKPRVNLHDGNGLPIESDLNFEGKRSILTFNTTHTEAASGAAVPVRNNVMAGSDGIIARTISVDSDGKPRVNLNDGNGLAIESALDFEGKRNILAYTTTHTEAASGSDVSLRNTLIAGSDGTKARTIATDANGKPKINMHYGDGSPVPFILDNAGMKNLPASMTHNIFLSTNNSSIANLNAGQEFLGTTDLNLNADAIQVCIKCDQPVKITVEQSNDGINWDFLTPYTLDANQAEGRLITCVGSFVRVRVRNDGSVATTYLNLQCVLVPFTSILPQSLTEKGNLKNSIEEIGFGIENRILNSDKAIFGQGMTATRISLVQADFALPLNNNDIGSALTGTGTITQSNSMAIVSTGTGVTSSAKIFTNGVVKYQPARETYCFFTAVFTTPTNANSNQRIGIFDASNGFFLGFQGLSFGITFRSNGVDSFTSQANFNFDKLNGTSGSRFTRDNFPEALDKTKLNVFRIRFGWLGGAVVLWEILNPDGNWILFHILKYPNTSNIPSVLNPNLPITSEVTKSSSDATNLSISSACLEGGVVGDSSVFTKEEIKGRKYVTAAVTGQTTDQTVYTVSTGRLLKVDTLIVSLSNSNLVQNGQLNIRDGVGGTILVPLSSPPSTNQSNAGNNLVVNFPTALRFINAVVADVVSGTLTYSLTFVGYEQEA